MTEIAIRARGLVLQVSDLPQSNRDRYHYPGGLHSPDEAAGMGNEWGCWVSRKRHVCRLQHRGTVQGWSESRQHVVAHRRGGRKVRLAQGVIREHEAFLGHEMRGPAGTGSGGVLMAGGRYGQGAGKGNWVRGHCLPSPSFFFLEVTYVFQLSVSISLRVFVIESAFSILIPCS